MIRCTFERFFFQTVFGFYEDWREHLERDSIRSVFSLGTLCLGLFLDAIRRGALALVFFLVSRGKREREREGELFGLARVICRIARNGDFISRKLEFQIGTEEGVWIRSFVLALSSDICCFYFVIHDFVN